MNDNTTKRTTKSAGQGTHETHVLPVMSQLEFAKLGGGEVAYIKTLSSDEAREMFPAIEGLPNGINLFSLHAADGTPIALTDTKQAALSHALEDELAIASVH
jgi:hypothetical protein